MRRGEVRWYRFRAPDKRRPVLILTRDPSIDMLHDVTIAPVTRTVRGAPSEVVLDQHDGMPQPSAVNLYYVRTVPKREIGGLITRLDQPRMREIASALKFALALDE